MIKKTKIIATLGPSIQEEKVLEKVLDKIDILRFNFSHLNPQQAKEKLFLVEKVLAKKKKKVGLLADLKGPEIRTDENEYLIKKNQTYTITYLEGDPNSNQIGIDFARLAEKTAVGRSLKADDGGVEFKVTKIKGKLVFGQAKNNYHLKPRKSVNVVKTNLELPIISARDKENLKFIAKENFSWVAASFVSKKEDVIKIKNLLKKSGKNIPIIAKIENYLAIKNIEEIINISEGIMVARGDLGVEYSYAEIPILQKMIVEKSQKKGKIIIVATQMLDSMMSTPFPSRPEATDVSNAVMSKVDAVMLSGETASGSYPLQAIEAMNNIIIKTEENIPHLTGGKKLISFKQEHQIIPFLRHGAELAELIKARYTISISERGKTATFLSAFKPNQLNIIATSNKALYYKMHLYYSIYPILIKETFSRKVNSQEEILEIIIKQLKQKKMIKKNDSIVFFFSFIYKKKYRGINSIREVKIH